MKIISADKDFLAYQKIFKHLKVNMSPIVLWQNGPDGRVVLKTVLNAFSNEKGTLHLARNSEVYFHQEIPLNFYSESVQIILKAEILELADKYIAIKTPHEIKVIEEADAINLSLPEVDFSTIWKAKRMNFMDDPEFDGKGALKKLSERSNRDQDFFRSEFDSISIDDEDRMFAEKRESPRTRAQVDKKVAIRHVQADKNYKFRLFDLSRGGLSFVIGMETLFKKGDLVLVEGFDNFELDDPIFGEVMSIRNVDNDILQWKVGVKFEQGLD